jgi:hypothetical protein
LFRSWKYGGRSAETLLSLDVTGFEEKFMKRSVEKFHSAVEKFTKKKTGLWSKPRKEFSLWLVRKRIPTWLRDHLEECVLRKTTHVGVAYFYEPSKIMRANAEYLEIIRSGFLQIGSAFDGDPLLMRFRGGRIAAGYLSHDALWTDPEEREVLFLPVASCLGKYAEMAAEISDCPIDYYGTKAE